MEQNKIRLKLENSEILFEVLPKFNNIYMHNIYSYDIPNEDITVLDNIENVSINDLFTLGGFYGTALYKQQQKES